MPLLPLCRHPTPSRLPGLVLGLGLLLAGGPVQASSLTLEQALVQALRDNPDYLAARQETAAAAGARQQAGLLPNPELRLRGTRTRALPARPVRLTLTQPFEPGRQARARVAVAEANAGVVDADLEARRYALRADIIQGFYELLLAEEGVRLAEQSQALAQRSPGQPQGHRFERASFRRYRVPARRWSKSPSGWS